MHRQACHRFLHRIAMAFTDINSQSAIPNQPAACPANAITVNQTRDAEPCQQPGPQSFVNCNASKTMTTAAAVWPFWF